MSCWSSEMSMSMPFLGARVSSVSNGSKVEMSRWKGMDMDISDDQQDIARGRNMVDSKFQGATGIGGTHNAVMSSQDYLSAGMKTYSAHDNITTENFYISPFVMSAGELESGNAGEPAKLVRQRYREASDIVKKGRMSTLFINDLDAGAGRMGGTTQYTVNNQMVNATLMNIADNPTNVQLPGQYEVIEIPRVPIIATGNDFSTLYAPLVRDGRMDKFYWSPTREDRVGIANGIFMADGIEKEDVEVLVDTFE